MEGSLKVVFFFSRFKRHDLLKLTCTLFAAYTEIRFSCDGAHYDKINSVVQLEKISQENTRMLVKLPMTSGTDIFTI